MKKKKILGVMFFNMFLNILLINENIYSEEYGGTNKIIKNIYFRLEVENSLFVAHDTELNFGDILKGSTGVVQKRNNIRVQGGDEISYVIAEYKDWLEDIEGWKKFILNFEEEEKLKKNIENESEEKNELEVYLKDFELNYKMEESKFGGKETEIPVIGEIRGVENNKIGSYKGVVKVLITAVSNNKLQEKWKE